MVSDVDSTSSSERFDFYDLGFPQVDQTEWEQMYGASKRYGQALASELW